MSRKKQASVPFNFAMNLLLKLSGTVFTAVSYPFAFRMIGETGMGRVAFAASVGSFFLMLAGMGVSTYGIRECARVREDPEALSRTARELLAMQLCMTLAAEVLLVCAVAAVPRLREHRALFLIQGALLLFHGLDTEWLFAGLERYGFLALRSFGVKLLSVVLILLFVHSPEDELLYALFIAAAAILGNLWNLWGARRVLTAGRGGGLLPLRHLRASSVFFLQTVATTVYTSLDSALLGFLRGDEAVGAYDAAAKVRMVLVLFITSLGTVLLPRFSYYVGEKREEEFRRGLRLSGGFVLLTALPLICYFLILGESCLQVLYGTVSRDTLHSLRLLMPTVLLIGCTNLLGIQLLTPLGRERAVMLSTALGAGVDLAADLLLIPALGAAGAALGTLIAEAAVLAAQVFFARGLGLRLLERKSVLRVLLATLAAAAVLLILRLSGLPDLGKALLGAAACFLTVFGLLLAVREPVLREILDRLKAGRA